MKVKDGAGFMPVGYVMKTNSHREGLCQLPYKDVRRILLLNHITLFEQLILGGEKHNASTAP